MSNLTVRASSSRIATVEINLKALAHNVHRVKHFSPSSKIIAVIKANAYGHGMLSVARQLASLNASETLVDCLAVAMIGEAIALRKAGIELPIIVFHGYADLNDLALMEAYTLQPVIHQMWQLELLEKHFSKSLDVWLKMDTGMHRLGLPADIMGKAIAYLNECENIGACRVMSHFANSDDVNNSFNIMQLKELIKVNNHFDAELSMANSAALIAQPESQLDWVRPGIMLYGSSPLIDRSAADLGLEAVMQFESQLLAVNALTAGDCIGYGGAYICAQDMLVGVVSVGYGDGYPRSAKNGTPVWINGKRCELVGRVSMDSICINLEGVAAKPGDRVVLWGNELSVDEVARNADTISYELLCRVGNAIGLN